MNLLSSEICEHILGTKGGETTMLQLLGGSHLVEVEGSPIIVEIVAMFAGHIVNTEMLVTRGLSMQAILGLYFLGAQRCVINTEQRVLHMHRCAIPLVQGKQTKGLHQWLSSSGVSSIIVYTETSTIK